MDLSSRKKCISCGGLLPCWIWGMYVIKQMAVKLLKAFRERNLVLLEDYCLQLCLPSSTAISSQ